jgi:hypothetical protein
MKTLGRSGLVALFAALVMMNTAFAALPDEQGAVFEHGVMVKAPPGNGGTAVQVFPKITGQSVVNAAVVDSQGTDNLSQTIWVELNTNWINYGPTQVIIDYTSLNKENITYSDIAATGADILIISVAGPYVHEYTQAEVDAITQYVEEGHGIIITYFSLEATNSGLAPLVGLEDPPLLGTNTFSGISYTLIVPNDPIFKDVTDPYDSGVPYMNTPGIYPTPWPVTTGEIIANALAMTGPYMKEGVIIKNEVATHRGVYFAHYIEDQSAGSNQEDKQTFYNAMIWAAGGDLSLTADTGVLSAREGGIVNFMLDADIANAKRDYILLGCVSGTDPGTVLPGGQATLPLNLDYFTDFVIAMMNTSLFSNFMATLDGDGMAKAQMDTLNLGTISPGCIGLTMHFAYALPAPWDFASNAVSVEIVP